MGSPLTQGLTGKQLGSNVVQTAGEFGERLATELSPRYYEWAYRGNVFNAVTQAVITFTAGLTTASGLVFGIQNAPSSNKNVVLLNASFALTGTTLSVIGLSVGPVTSTLNTATTTGPTIQGALNATSTGGSVCRVVSVVASPVVVQILGGMSAASAAVVATNYVELAGSIIVGPGATVCMVASAAQTAWGSLTWVELPI